MKKLIVMILAIQMMHLPITAQAASDVKVEKTAKRVENNVMLKLIRDEAATNPAFYYPDAELTQAATTVNKALGLAEMDALIAKIKDPSHSMESLKSELIKRATDEEQAQIAEFGFLLERMPPETLDRMFQTTIQKGNYRSSIQSEYEAAYTQREKVKIVLGLVANDIYQVKTQTLKRLGLATRENLVKELESTRALLNTKDRDSWKIVLIVVVSVALAGLTAWGIVSATKARYERKLKDLEKEYDGKNDSLTQEYIAKEQSLHDFYANRDRLRELGYVETVCQTTTQSQAVSCAYDGLTHSGPQICSTRCLKNPTTNDSINLGTSCTSAFVPANCTQQNPYVAGYNTGYDNGYDDGYSDGYTDLYEQTYLDYYNAGYDDGYIAGYDTGYNDGFTDGLNQAEYDYIDGVSRSATDSVGSGYKKGYTEGYAAAYQMVIP